MLPHVHAKNGYLTANNRILVLGRDNAQPPLLILDQPTPATPLDPQERGRKLLFEPLKASPDLGDLGRKSRGSVNLGFGRPSRGEILPEESVVDVTAAVEANGGLQGDAGRDIGGGSGRGVDLEGGVEVGYVGLVMFAMVELHDLG